MADALSGANVLNTAPGRLLASEPVSRVETAGDAMRSQMDVDERHLGPDGRTALGALGVLADEVLGYSIIASLPPDSWTVSTEIWLDLLVPLPVTGRLTAEAHTAQTGSFAVGRVRDEEGRVVVECRERGRRIGELPPADPAVAAELPAYAEGGLASLLGLSLGDVSRLEVVPALENPRRKLHGGVSLAAAEVVATWSRVQAGCPLATTSVHVVHTRAADAGDVVELSVETVHAGRSLWVSDVTGSVAGRPVVEARVSAQ